MRGITAFSSHLTHKTDECWEENECSNTIPVNTMATVWMLQSDTFQSNQRGGLIAILVVCGGKQKSRVILLWRWVQKHSRGSIIRLDWRAMFDSHRGGLMEVQQLSFYTKRHAISNLSIQLLNKLPAACSKAAFDESLLSLHWGLRQQSTLFFTSTLSRKSWAASWTFIWGHLNCSWMKICFPV